MVINRVIFPFTNIAEKSENQDVEETIKVTQISVDNHLLLLKARSIQAIFFYVHWMRGENKS